MIKLTPITQSKLDVLVDISIYAYSRDLFISGEIMDKQRARQSTQDEINYFMPEGLQTPDMGIFSVEQEGGDIGYLWYNIKREQGAAQSFLTYIHVDPGRRGQGLAQKIMSAYEQAALDTYHVTNYQLVVFIHNKPAVNLYKKCGYRIVRALNFYDSVEPKRYLMSKDAN